jgi:hypothetical protein
MRGAQQPLDFMAYSPDRRLVAAVEAKRVLDTTIEWAMKYRRNLVGYATLREIPYLVIATPDRIYIWKAPLPDDARPTAVIDGLAAFAPYYKRVGVDASHIQPMAFELLVLWWLSDLASSLPSEESALHDSGLLEALADAEFTRQEAA